MWIKVKKSKSLSLHIASGGQAADEEALVSLLQVVWEEKQFFFVPRDDLS